MSGGQKTNPAWTSEIGDEEFAGAVKESLRLRNLLAEGDAGKYQLEVKLLKVDQPLFGLDFKVTMQAQYILKEAATGKILLDKTLVTDYTAGVGDAFVAIKRLRLANEGSAKTNIGAFLAELATLKIAPKDVSLAKGGPEVSPLVVFSSRLLTLPDRTRRCFPVPMAVAWSRSSQKAPFRPFLA